MLTNIPEPKTMRPKDWSKYLTSLGFEYLRNTTHMALWKHPSGCVVGAPSRLTNVDPRAHKNCLATIRRALREYGLDSGN